MKLPEYKGAAHPTYSAAPQTYVVELGESGSVLKTPVIGWAPDAENPYRAPHPITVTGTVSLTTGRAIMHPCGMVDDPEHNLTFASDSEWMVVASKEPRSSERAPYTPGPRQAVAEVPVNSALQIEWITKPFKTNSFYRYTDGDVDFLFQVEGGLNPPKQKAPVEKIKRDEFMSLKKTVDVADYDDLVNGRAPGLDDIGSFENDDDDLLGDVLGDQDDEDLI